jgi:abequosyltransferase
MSDRDVVDQKRFLAGLARSVATDAMALAGGPPLLSVCIPTYNRAKCLDLALGSFCAQVKACGRSDIQLLVSDNASTDNTWDIIQHHKLLFPDLIVMKNEANLGADGNFLGLLRAATGRFCWIFGDDDLLLQGGLSLVVDVLDAHRDLGLLHIASKYHTKSDQVINQEARIDYIEEITDHAVFWDRIGVSITFITGNIFNLSYLEAEFDYVPFTGTNLVQVSFYLQSLLGGASHAYLAGSIYSAMSDNTGGYRLFKTFGPNFNHILTSFRKRGFRDKWTQRVNRKLCVSFFPGYLLGMRRNKSKFNPEQALGTLWPVYKYYKEFWVFVIPLAILPSALSNSYYCLCRWVIEKIKTLRRLARGRRRSEGRSLPDAAQT